MKTLREMIDIVGPANEGWRGGLAGEPDMVKTRQSSGGSKQEQAYEDLMTWIDGSLTRGLLDPKIAKHLRQLVLQLKPGAELEEATDPVEKIEELFKNR